MRRTTVAARKLRPQIVVSGEGRTLRKPRDRSGTDAELGVERRLVAKNESCGMIATTEHRAWREAHAASRRDNPVCVRPSSPTTACAACTASNQRDAAWVALACDSPYDHHCRQSSADLLMALSAEPSQAPVIMARCPGSASSTASRSRCTSTITNHPISKPNTASTTRSSRSAAARC